jgi:hypothetical protein
MRFTGFLTRPMAIATAVGTAVVLIVGGTSASAGTSPAGHSPRAAVRVVRHGSTSVLYFRDGMVVVSRWLKGNSRELPRLPRGERYAAQVMYNTEIRPPDIPLRQLVAGLRGDDVRPDSASGCTPYGGTVPPYTCIYVYGSGLQVIYWTTGVTLKKPPSTPTSYYLINGTVRDTNAFYTTSSGFGLDTLGYLLTYAFYIAGSPTPYIFGNNTKVCNYWTGAAIKSEPCETVHS